jgi:ribosomal silencing factor RsfS
MTRGKACPEDDRKAAEDVLTFDMQQKPKKVSSYLISTELSSTINALSTASFT